MELQFGKLEPKVVTSDTYQLRNILAGEYDILIHTSYCQFLNNEQKMKLRMNKNQTLEATCDCNLHIT